MVLTLSDIDARILVELLLADIAEAIVLVLEAEFIEHNAIGLVIINQRLDLVVEIIPYLWIYGTEIVGIATNIGFATCSQLVSILELSGLGSPGLLQ